MEKKCALPVVVERLLKPVLCFYFFLFYLLKNSKKYWKGLEREPCVNLHEILVLTLRIFLPAWLGGSDRDSLDYREFRQKKSSGNV